MNAAPIRPMLDDMELPLVQVLRTEEDQVWVEQGVPALDGSLFQRLGRAPTHTFVQGVMSGSDAVENVEKLRKLFQAAEPVTFTADIMTATQVTQMLITDLAVRELAGKPHCFSYAATLVEFTPTPEPVRPGPGPGPGPGPTPVPCDQQKGSIEVTVLLPQGQADFTGIVVRIERTDGSLSPIEITEQVNGVYSRPDLPTGEYRATAFRRGAGNGHG